MGELNCRDSHMATYWQEIRKLEEKFDSFKLHHILRRDNGTADALTQLRSSREPPPLSVFTQDLFKPSIRLEEDIPVPMLGASPDEDNPTLYQSQWPHQEKDGSAPTFEVNQGDPVGPIKPNLGPEGEIATVIRPPNPEVNW
jgi:hypothetical protein